MAAKKPGRPPMVKPTEEICARLVEGESLRSICRSEGMPGLRTVFDWLEVDEEFRSKYTRAREVQAELQVDEMREIADDGRNDWMETFGKDGESTGWKINGEAVQRSKIRLEQRRWYVEKLLPKKYGARLQQDIHVSRDPKDMSLEDIDAELAAMAAAHGQEKTGSVPAGDGAVP